MRTRLRLIEALRVQGVRNEEILKTMEKIPRHLFVDSAISHRAYENVALPIDAGQTISQPYTVARITELLLAGLQQIEGKCRRVLEIGSGCGYQAAILSSFFNSVYGVDRIGELCKKARKNLEMMNLANVHIAHKDGSHGWKEAAPFDGIVISAATEQLPEKLMPQLSPQGCIVLPLGKSNQQRLRLIKYQNGRVLTEDHDFVLFVPLLSGTA